MIVGAGAGYQSPIASVKRTDDTKDTSSTDKTDRTDKTDDTQAQFSALMALLGGTNSKIRTDLLKQVPAKDSSLLDKLLSGASENAGETDATSAADAARYGMLLGNSTTDINAIIADLQNAKATTATNRISPEVLTRISGKSPSVEDLLAVGDKDAAAAKAKLDALLATAGTSDAAALAAANALATALAASAANTATPITGTEGLDPDFKAKLDAVIARMKDEYGSDVTVVETVRSQDRQDALFAQGRTAPGEVVTWTQDSAHTRGQAADVLVDGKWNNEKGYDLLQQIAKEEGLRTLGAKDPGHLELSADAQAVANARLVKASVTATGSQNSGVARVASVANVASVASVGNATVTSVKSTPASTTNNAPINLMAQATRTQTDSRSTGDGAKSDSKKESSADATRTTADESATLGALSRGTQQKFVGPVDTIERPAPVAGADGAQRVQDIDAMRDQTSPSAVSQIKLEVDGPNGDTQHITVDMRGNTVGTNISTDAASADRMRARVGDLHGALESQGLQVDSVHISTAPRSSNPADQVKQVSPGDAMRLGGAASSNASDSNLQQQSQRDRSPATRDWEDRQAAREEQRRSKQQPQDRQRQQYQEKQ